MKVKQLFRIPHPAHSLKNKLQQRKVIKIPTRYEHSVIKWNVWQGLSRVFRMTTWWGSKLPWCNISSSRELVGKLEFWFQLEVCRKVLSFSEKNVIGLIAQCCLISHSTQQYQLQSDRGLSALFGEFSISRERKHFVEFHSFLFRPFLSLVLSSVARYQPNWVVVEKRNLCDCGNHDELKAE